MALSLMSTPDWFLVAWWLLAAIVGIPACILAYFRLRSDRLYRQKVVLDYLKGIPKLPFPARQGPRCSRRRPTATA